MAFPSNPNNGDTYIRYGRTYEYDSTMLMWKVKKSGIQLEELSDVDVTTTAPVVGDTLVWNGTKFEPDEVNPLSVYQSELPLTGNVTGQMAYVIDSSRLYMFTGAGWFNIALVNTNPTITSAPDGSYAFATDGTPIVLTLEAQDPEELPVTWSYAVTSGTLGNTATITQVDNVFTITPSVDTEDVGTFSITFTASDGVNLATAVSSFSLNFLSTTWKYMELSVGTSSTSGINQKTFIDRSTNAFTVTPSGDVKQVGYSPYSPAGWSAYFDGGDYLNIPYNSGHALSNQDFTIEAFIRPTVATTTMGILNNWQSGGAFTFGMNSSYTMQFTYTDAAGGISTKTFNGTSETVKVNQWNHVAIVRNGATLTLYVNGVADSTTYNIGSSTIYYYNSANKDIRVGTGPDLTSKFTGYLSNVRMVVGTALYTTGFTPPTEKLSAVTGTKLLVLQDIIFVDNSEIGSTIAITGDPKISQLSGLPRSEEYLPSIYGGSAYFDGSGDHLQLASTTELQFDTGDFTIECWVYPLTTDSRHVISIGNWDTSGSVVLIQYLNNWSLRVGGFAVTGIVPIVKNVWSHIAITKTSDSVNLFINGVAEYTRTDSTSITRNDLNIGWQTGGGTGNWGSFSGYISDFRIIKGTSLYSSDFTPPTAPVGSTNAALYLPMDNIGVYDKTGNYEITVVNDAVTSNTLPKYTTTSMYFDGTSDYLTMPAIKMGYADFTIEAWVYMETAATRIIVATDFSSGVNFQLYVENGYIKWQMFSAGSPNGTQTITAQTWNHVAWTRSGDQNYVFVNGVLSSTATNTTTANPTGLMYIGGRGTTLPWHGYIEGLQISNSYAKYTTAFTPPTQEQGVTYQLES